VVERCSGWGLADVMARWAGVVAGVEACRLHLAGGHRGRGAVRVGGIKRAGHTQRGDNLNS
jgi:hypothetical protein